MKKLTEWGFRVKRIKKQRLKQKLTQQEKQRLTTGQKVLAIIIGITGGLFLIELLRGRRCHICGRKI